MARRYLPEEFDTEVTMTSIVVTAKDGQFLMAYTLEDLADKFLSGAGRISPDERAIAGAAFQHLIGLWE